MSSDFFTDEYLAARRAALQNLGGPEGMDDGDPTGPCGHAYGIAVSSRLTSTFRRQKNIAMDVTPEQVIDCMNDAKIKNWVLMGLHGYVGYLPEPRATQDVDVMVPYSQRDAAEKAIAERWPDLLLVRHSQVSRFMDPDDVDQQGKPKPVIDLMLPWGKFQEVILSDHVVENDEPLSYFPTLEAAIVSKYAALVSPYRRTSKKQYDAGDLQLLIRNNFSAIDHGKLEELASLVWDGGGKEILEFLDIAMQDKPFPI